VGTALASLRSAVAEDAPAAGERALALVATEDHRGWGVSVAVRIALAPLCRTTLLDPLAPEQPSLGDDLISALRAGGSIPQIVGVEAEATSDGIRLVPFSQQSGPTAIIGSDGSILIEGSAAGGGRFAGMRIAPDALAEFLFVAGRSAQLVRERIDIRGEVGQVAVAACIPDAQHLAYGGSGNSLSMAGSLPGTVIVPDPPRR